MFFVPGVIGDKLPSRTAEAADKVTQSCPYADFKEFVRKIHEASLAQKAGGERASELLAKVDVRFKALEVESKRKMSEVDYDKEQKKVRMAVEGKLIEIREQ